MRYLPLPKIGRALREWKTSTVRSDLTTLKERCAIMRIDWRRKLTSRKLWIAVAGLISGLILAFGGEQSAADTVSGVLLQLGSVVGYLIAESTADAAA